MNGMMKWCSDHPWMTFFIVTSLIGVLKPSPLIQIGSPCDAFPAEAYNGPRPMSCGNSPLGQECFYV